MRTPDNTEEMSSEYNLDYAKAKPNRFTGKYQRMQRTVVLDFNVAENFPNAESVNEALRFLIRVTQENKAALQDK